MKNLHVLTTENQSRFRYNTITKIWELNEFPKYHTDIKSTHNIYITSDEEIKMQDWFIDDKYKQPMKYFGEGSLLISSKKIILTTDPDLIKNGVQAIDAEFLEWFCSKNGKVGYIESKQGRTCTNNCSVVCGECQIFDKKPITNLEKLLFPELVTELVGYYKNTQLIEKPKEVVEKTTKMYSEEEVKTIINDIVEKHCTYFSQGIKEGIKLEWFKKFKK